MVLGEKSFSGSGTDRVGGGKGRTICCEALALAGGGFSLAGGIGQALDTRGTSIH